MADGRRLRVLVLLRHRRAPPLHVGSTAGRHNRHGPSEPARMLRMAVRTLVTSTLSSSVSCHCTCRTTTNVDRVAPWNEAIADQQIAQVSSIAALSREVEFYCSKGGGLRRTSIRSPTFMFTGSRSISSAISVRPASSAPSAGDATSPMAREPSTDISISFRTSDH